MPFDGHDFPQVIPTPPYAVPGSQAPWHELPANQRSRISLARVEEALRANDRHYDATSPPPLSPELQRMIDQGDALPISRRSAVLAALFEEDGESRIILTRRSQSLKNHRGEIALPGGRSDEGESPVATALREAHEEVNLDPRDARVIGWLTPIVTFASGSAIQPVVALLDRRPTLTANPAEVERIFDVSLSDLLAEGNFLEQRWRRDTPRPGADPDGTFPIYFYRVPGEVVWGATGRVLTELLAAVTGTSHAMTRGPLA